MRSRRLEFLLLTLLIAGAPASAQQLQGTDQSSPGDAAFSHLWDQSVVQTFIPTKNNVIGAGFHLGCYAASPCNQPVTATIRLWAGTPTVVPSGIPLASGNVGLPPLANFGDVETFDAYWSTVMVTPGNMYYLELISDATQYGWVTFITNNGTTPGNVFHSGNDTPGSAYTSYPDTDLNFREFYDENLDPPNAVPEPATIVLMASGLAAIGVVARRRRVS